MPDRKRQKRPCLLQEADNEAMTNGCFCSLIGLVATQMPVILGYKHINIYIFNLKVTLQFSRKQTTSQETDISYKVTKAKIVSLPNFNTASGKNPTSKLEFWLLFSLFTGNTAGKTVQLMC